MEVKHVLTYEKVNSLQNNYMLTFTFVKDYYLDEKNRLFFVHAGFTNIMNGVTYEFFQVILLGQNLMGNYTVFRPKNKTNDLLYQNDNVV
jgi:hypothetical protein